MASKEIAVEATEHDSAHEAIQYLDCSGHDRAVSIGGKYLTMRESEAQRLEAMGLAFAYLSHHEPTGRIMTVPVN